MRLKAIVHEWMFFAQGGQGGSLGSQPSDPGFKYRSTTQFNINFSSLWLLGILKIVVRIGELQS